jgi:hypothetical protein
MVLQHYISYIQFSRYKCLNNSNLQGIISEWSASPKKNLCVSVNFTDPNYNAYPKVVAAIFGPALE